MTVFSRDSQVLMATVALAAAITPLRAANITWIGGDVDWIDAGATVNWTPADEPDTDDVAIFNTANAVSMGSNNAVLGITMSGGIDLFTNAFVLDVNGLVQLSGAGTNLTVGGAASQLLADSVTINSGAVLNLAGGTASIIEETGSGLLDINAGGTLAGYGSASMNDAVAAGTTLIINDGTITARHSSPLIFGTPPVDTLSLNATDADTRIDLDGAGEAGVVNVTRNQTLDVNIQLLDIFNGLIEMAHNTTLDMSNAWILGANATLDVNNGFVDGTFPNPDIPAGTSTIAGASLSQNGGAINVVDTDGTLIFDAAFTMNAGAFDNQGHVIFNANATINSGGTFNMGPSGSDLTVGAGRTVAIDQASFNLDGNLAGTVITVNEGATLNLDLGDYDNDAATNAFDGTVTLNGGTIDVTTGDAEFVMDGALNMNSAVPGPIVAWIGEPFDLGNDAGVLDADLNVTGTQQSQFGAQVDFNSDADVDIAAGATLAMLSTVNFATVNAANNAQFTGAGRIVFSGQVNVNEAVTLNMVGGEVDLDGLDSVGDFVNIDAPLTISASTMANFGRVNGGGGTNTLDVNNSVGSGALTVNLDDPNAEWTLNGPGVMNLVNDNTEATLLAGSDVNINGTVNVTGDVRTTARLDIAGVVNINTAAQPLRLAGGTLSSDPNTISGGTINGVGLLGADTSRALRGFGTINTGIDFDGTASLLADNGTLTINGAIADVGTIGTFDVDGTLHVTNAWNNNVSTGVQLNGGTLSGGTITNDVATGISGHGLVTARVINNTQLFASIGDSLIFQTAGNDNDWDGSGAGEIEAVSGNIELRDTGPAFGFTGTVTASNNHTAFTNGFALDFNPGSSLQLASGGTYESTNSTDIGGTVTVGAGAASTIRVEVNRFLTFESTSVTTLDQNLRLENNNINIEAGSTFSGSGALVVAEGSHLVVDAGATIGVLLENRGTIRPADFDTVGRVDLVDYQQTGTGSLNVEITGTSLNQFDRFVVTGSALLDGMLDVSIEGGFLPVLGNTFNIITAIAVSGTFDSVTTSGFPAGLTVQVNYLPNILQLQVVTASLVGDLDGDGFVGITDLNIVLGNWNQNVTPGAKPQGDPSGDGFVGIEDLNTVLGNWNAGTPPTSANVPEPATVAYVAACGLISLRRTMIRA